MEETTDIGLLWHSANGEWCIAKNLVVFYLVEILCKGVGAMYLYPGIKTPGADLGNCGQVFCAFDAAKIILIAIGKRLIVSAS